MSIAVTTMSEMKTQFLTKVTEDGDFRAELGRDAEATISAELGVFITEGFTE